jgi:hypothetical protein
MAPVLKQLLGSAPAALSPFPIVTVWAGGAGAAASGWFGPQMTGSFKRERC